jgi:Family of unknown function (DUF5407)
MIIRRIQAIEPAEEQTEGEKNNGRVQDSTHINTQRARNNHFSQLSAATANLVSATSSAILSMARNLKG